MATLAKILITLYCLSTLGFFQPMDMIPAEATKVVSYLCMFLLFVLSIMARKRVRPTKQFATPTRALVAFIAISCIMPMFSLVDQTFMQTVVATIPFFGYGLYIAIREFDIDYKFFYRLIFAIATIATITHIINHITFPVITFGATADEYDTERGGLRLQIIGFAYVILAFFIALNEWNRAKKWGWLISAIIFYVTIASTFTRQHIVACFVIGLWVMLNQSSFVKKVSIIAIASLFLILILPSIPAFDDMVEMTVEQYEANEYSNKEDARLVAMRYYGWEGYDSPLNQIFGHGMPSFLSKWGMECKTFSEMEKIFQHDVGWFGTKWYFGIGTVICLMIICISALFKKTTSTNIGIRHYFVWLFATSFTNGALLYPWEITVTVIAMCLLDCYIPSIEQRTRKVGPTLWGDEFNWRRVQQ